MSILKIVITVHIVLLMISPVVAQQTERNVVPVSVQFPPAASPSVIITIATVSRGKVDIHYDLSYPEGSPCAITLEYKGAGVPDWTQATAFIGETEGIYPAAGLSVTWDSVVDIPDADGEFYIRMSAHCGIVIGPWATYGPVILPDAPPKSITVTALDRRTDDNCISITYIYNEYVTGYSLFWTDDLPVPPVVWHEIPDIEDTAVVNMDGSYTWSDCGDAAHGRSEPDNDTVPHRFYYLGVQ